MRLFIALHLEPATLAPALEIQQALRAADSEEQVRWVDPRGMHLTLKFLGETDPGRAREVTAALARAVTPHDAPRLAAGGVGGFPNLRNPRVLWIGLEEDGKSLLPLQVAVEEAAARLGWERERRSFTPHLTLGRRREGPGSRPGPLGPGLCRALEATPGPRQPFRAQRRLALIRSHLEPRGARYEDLASWELGSPETTTEHG